MFIDTTFPQGLMPYFTKEISYISNINVAQSGLEYRKLVTPQNNTVYKLYTSIKKSEDIQTLQNFFHITQGKTLSFKLYDETDCYIEKNPALILDKNTVQIQKIININGTTWSEIITKPKNGTVIVYNGQTPVNTGFTINFLTGKIVFNSDISNAQIYISANYFKQVRFNNDSIAIKSKGGNAFEIENIIMKTVIN